MILRRKWEGAVKWALRHFLLDDTHERQPFRSSKGQEFARQKELREMGAAALNYGNGYAVRLTPSNDWLPLLLPSNVRVAASQSEISLIPSAVDGSATE